MNSNIVDITSLTQRSASHTGTKSRPQEAAPEQGATRRAEGGTGSAAKTERAAPDREQIDEVIERVASLDKRLTFQVDDESGRTVIYVRDASTSEVLKQIPSEEMLHVARRLEAHLSEAADGSGVLLAEEA